VLVAGALGAALGRLSEQLPEVGNQRAVVGVVAGKGLTGRVSGRAQDGRVHVLPLLVVSGYVSDP